MPSRTENARHSSSRRRQRGARKALAGHVLLVAVAAAVAGCATSSAPDPAQRDARATDHYVQGAIAYQQGDKDRALEALRAALVENPDLIMARYLLGHIHREQGDVAAAEAEYQRVVQLDPYSYKNHYFLGLAQHLLNKLQEASVSYLRALNLNPEDPKSNMNLGLVYTALGRPELGLPYAKKAVELDPKSSEAATNLAVVLDSAGQHAEAELSYRRALEMDGGRPETMLNLASSLVAQKRYRDAILVYEQLLPKMDTTLVRQRYGYALLNVGRYDESIEQFNAALRQSVQNYHALNGLGEANLALYLKSSMLDEARRQAAVKYWQRSLAINAAQPRIQALVQEYADKKLFP